MKFGRAQLICFLLAGVTVALFWPLTQAQFLNHDDPEYIVTNAAIQHGVTLPAVAWALKSFYASNWHPLTWISHELDWDLYGPGAGGHHLTNILLHTVNAVLLFLLLQQMTAAPWRSAFVAALFAWHPLHVESVAWVSERKDVLSMFFGLLTIYAYVRYAKGEEEEAPGFRVQGSEVGNPNRSLNRPGEGSSSCIESTVEDMEDAGKQCSMPNAQRSMFNNPSLCYILALLLFVLALMSKPMMVTLPFVLLLLDFWPLKRMQSAECRMQNGEEGSGKNGEGQMKRDGGGVQSSKVKVQGSRFNTQVAIVVLEKLPFLALAAMDCLATMWAQEQDALVNVAVLPLPSRIANALMSYVFYLWKTVWPSNLSVLYPYPANFNYLAAAACGLLLAASAAAVWQWRRRPYLAIGWFWFLGTLVPTIGLVQVGMQPRADRYTYLPLIGIFVIAAWAFPACKSRRKEALSPKSEINNLNHKISRPPYVGSYIAWSVAVCALIALIAFTRLQLRYWHDSVALFTRATEVTGDSILAEYNLAEALARSGEEDKAIKHYLKAIELPPNRLENWHSSKPFAQYNLGMLFANRGDWAAAEPRFRAALRSYPGSSVLRANLANSLTALGRLNEAIPQYRIALRDGQKSAEIWRGFATALDRHGDWSEAGDAYQEAARLAPQNPVDLNNLAWFLATTPKAELRNATEALTLAQAAAGLTARREPLCLASLDAAYAGAGNFDQAITAAQQTRDLALSLARQDVAQAASERLDLYRAGKPFRQQLPFPRGARE